MPLSSQFGFYWQLMSMQAETCSLVTNWLANRRSRYYFHIGSHKGAGFGPILPRLWRQLIILDSSPRGTRLILKTRLVMWNDWVSFYELREIIDGLVTNPKSESVWYPARLCPNFLWQNVGSVYSRGRSKISGRHSFNDSRLIWFSCRPHENLDGKIGKEALSKFAESCKLKIKNCPLIPRFQETEMVHEKRS